MSIGSLCVQTVSVYSMLWKQSETQKMRPASRPIPKSFFWVIVRARANMFTVLALLISAAFAEGFVRTPFGLYPEACVHRVPSGAHITTRDSKTVVIHERLKGLFLVPECDLTTLAEEVDEEKVTGKEKRQFPPNYDGWLAYTSYQTKLPTFDTFLGTTSFSVFVCWREVFCEWWKR